jgi:hypothetical protein
VNSFRFTISKEFKQPNLLNSVVFAAADFLSIRLLFKFMRSFPALPEHVPGEYNVNPEHPPFSPALSLITELDLSDQTSEDSNAHLLHQYETDLAEQNAHDCEEYTNFVQMSDRES